MRVAVIEMGPIIRNQDAGYIAARLRYYYQCRKGASGRIRLFEGVIRAQGELYDYLREKEMPLSSFRMRTLI